MTNSKIDVDAPGLPPNAAKDVWFLLRSVEHERSIWLWAARHDPVYRGPGLEDVIVELELQRKAWSALRCAFENSFGDYSSHQEGRFEPMQSRLDRGVDAAGIALFARYLETRRRYWAETPPAAASEEQPAVYLQALDEASALFHARVGVAPARLHAWACSIRTAEDDPRPPMWRVSTQGYPGRVTGPGLPKPSPLEGPFLERWRAELEHWLFDTSLPRLEWQQHVDEDETGARRLWPYGFATSFFLSITAQDELRDYEPETGMPRNAAQRAIFERFLDIFPEPKREAYYHHVYAMVGGRPDPEKLCEFAGWLKANASRPKRPPRVRAEWETLKKVTGGLAERWAEGVAADSASVLIH